MVLFIIDNFQDFLRLNYLWLLTDFSVTLNNLQQNENPAFREETVFPAIDHNWNECVPLLCENENPRS